MQTIQLQVLVLPYPSTVRVSRTRCAGSAPSITFLCDKPWHKVVFKSHQFKQNLLKPCQKPRVKFPSCVLLSVFPSLAFYNNKYQTSALGSPGIWIGSSQSPFNTQMLSLCSQMATCWIRAQFIHTELGSSGWMVGYVHKNPEHRGLSQEGNRTQNRAEFTCVQESKYWTCFCKILIFLFMVFQFTTGK